VAVFAVPAGPVADAESLVRRISDAVAASLGNAFRPSSVHLVPDLPRTRSAKIMRRVVRARALGKAVGDISSLENPDSLDGIRPL
jgi:acetyl-CoA synthetase